MKTLGHLVQKARDKTFSFLPLSLSRSACHGVLICSGPLQENIIDWVPSITEMYFIPNLETGKSKIKVPADLVPGENPLPSLQTAAFQLCPHMAQREKEHCKSLSSYHYIDPIVGTSPLKISSKPDYLPRAPPPKAIMLRVKASTYEWASGGQKQSIGFQWGEPEQVY